MPNVTIYFSVDQMPSNENLAQLTDQCTQHCTGLLQAALKNVHIIYVGVLHGAGHPVFAEVQYRIEPFRTPPVMEKFMEALEASIRNSTGLTARIRCFGYDASSIHARN